VTDFPSGIALIIGAGPGISASLTRQLSSLGVKVGLAARDTGKLGAILLTGASASIKGFPLSSAFAMGKFALRGMAQSAARELGPKGIHVAHFVIDGGVRSSRRHDPADKPDSTLDPDAIAKVYIDVMRQHRSAWSLEVELRPWVERF